MFVLRLAISSPLRRLFDYLPPVEMSAATTGALKPGIRLRVPFGQRIVIGYLVEVCNDSELTLDSLKPALAVLDEDPLIDHKLLQLCQWAASYYHHPHGDVFSALFPKNLRAGKTHQPLGENGWALSTRGKGLAEDALMRSPRQAEAIGLLRDQNVMTAGQLRESGISDAVMRSLRDKDLVEGLTVNPINRAADSAPGLTLNTEQASVLGALIQDREGFSCHLLEGVTGSGKTEVYLQLIADCLKRGLQTLVLIPEIGLTPQTLGRFQRRFSANIAVLHSGLSDGQRYQAWEAARSGNAHIIIGTRSAVFTPLNNLGLIIVDEEHDRSYKQQDGFRYSARDVAVKRAQLHDCPVLLGSATPSLESVYNALSGRYRHHHLTQRAGGATMPAIQLLDVRRKELPAGLSATLMDAAGKCLRQGQQVLLFLNRRGYAPSLQCHDCGWVAECRACDARLTVHRRQRRLRCHHCGAASTLPRQCPQCHSQQLITAGLGTEQAEEFLHTRFSEWPIHRVDSDSMQSRDAMQAMVEQINREEPCILLGTQMLTKGHHFPGVSLVAVIDADALLFSADFRGEERMAQLLTQVAGRAGRAGTPGSVILQTHYPDHPSLMAMLKTSYAEQAKALLKQREATGMPPSGQLVIMRTDCQDADLGEQFLEDLRRRCDSNLAHGTALIGPLPSPMQRRAGKYRSVLLLTAPDRRAAQVSASVMVTVAETLSAKRGLKWTIDVDPQDVF